MNEMFFVKHPVQLLIGQFKGEIVSTETPSVFNKQFGKLAHCKIVGLHKCELVFTGRVQGPHLQLDRHRKETVDISQAGLWALVAIEHLRTGTDVHVASFFARYENSYQRACEFLKRLASK